MKRSLRHRPPASYLVLAIIISFVLARAGWQVLGPELPTDQPQETQATETGGLVPGPCEVVRVVDGDTLILTQPSLAESNGARPQRNKQAAERYRVRLLGVDTPETVKEGTDVQEWGPEATEFTRQFVRGGKVRVELDKRRVDRFGRSLAYVYVGDEMLNVELVRAGLARIAHYPGDSTAMLRLLREAEAEAKAARRGIWSRGAPVGAANGKSNR